MRKLPEFWSASSGCHVKSKKSKSQLFCDLLSPGLEQSSLTASADTMPAQNTPTARGEGGSHRQPRQHTASCLLAAPSSHVEKSCPSTCHTGPNQWNKLQMSSLKAKPFSLFTGPTQHQQLSCSLNQPGSSDGNRHEELTPASPNTLLNPALFVFSGRLNTGY